MEYVLEVARKKNFTRAAQSLCIAQPSLSQQIAKVERELGIPLFYRGHGKVELTPEGTRFVEVAEQILQLRDDLLREMKERREGMGRDLVIGTTAITGGHVLPPLLEVYKQRYPQVQVQLVEESSARLKELAARGFVDLAILSLPIDDSRLTTRAMLTEPLYLALPRKEKRWMTTAVRQRIAERNVAPMARPEDIPSFHLPLCELAQAPFIVLKQGYGFRNTLLELCAKSGFQPQIAYETSSIETAQSLVTHGLGVTLVPQMVMRTDDRPHPFYFSLEPPPTRTLVFAYRQGRYLSLAAQALLQVYEEYEKHIP